MLWGTKAQERSRSGGPSGSSAKGRRSQDRSDGQVRLIETLKESRTRREDGRGLINHDPSRSPGEDREAEGEVQRQGGIAEPITRYPGGPEHSEREANSERAHAGGNARLQAVAPKTLKGNTRDRKSVV